MAISNELISDIAVALVAANNKHPGQPNDLKKILLEVYSTLRRLREQSRRARTIRLSADNSHNDGN